LQLETNLKELYNLGAVNVSPQEINKDGKTNLIIEDKIIMTKEIIEESRKEKSYGNIWNKIHAVYAGKVIQEY